MKPEEFDTQFLAWLEAQIKNDCRRLRRMAKRIEGRAMAAAAKARARRSDQGRARTSAISSPTTSSTAAPTSCWRTPTWPRATKPRRIARAGAVLARSAAAIPRPEETRRRLQEEAGRPKEAAKDAGAAQLYLSDGRRSCTACWGPLYGDRQSAEGAIREYSGRCRTRSRSIQPQSHFNLARALRSANRTDEAKEQLLLALEAAPGFKPAQKMLLAEKSPRNNDSIHVTIALSTHRN